MTWITRYKSIHRSFVIGYELFETCELKFNQCGSDNRHFIRTLGIELLPHCTMAKHGGNSLYLSVDRNMISKVYIGHLDQPKTNSSNRNAYFCSIIIPNMQQLVERIIPGENQNLPVPYSTYGIVMEKKNVIIFSPRLHELKALLSERRQWKLL